MPITLDGMTTTARLLQLLSLLQTPREWPGSVLAERLDVSERTVRRDVERLRDLGYRIAGRVGPAGGYRLQAGSDLPPLLFDADQALAVAIALQTVRVGGAPIDEAAHRALGTIRQVLPAPLRHRLDTVEVTTVPLPGEGAEPDVSLDAVATVAAAISARETLRFDYTPIGADGDAADAARPPRRAEPHHLVATRGRWYVLAWDVDRADWRVFAVDRLRLRTHNGARFAPRAVPGGDPAAFVSARFRGSPDGQWPCRGTVLLHLPARDVLPFAGDGTVVAVGDDACTLEAGSWSWGALAASFARFDAPMDVVGPAELAAACTTLARRFADAAAVAAADATADGDRRPAPR